jgi:Ni,Fe-hydrogenase I small subunit
MRPNLYWLQCGGCGGDTMSMLSADSPNIAEATISIGIDVLFHPSFSALTPARHLRLLDDLTGGTLRLDFL